MSSLGLRLTPEPLSLHHSAPSPSCNAQDYSVPLSQAKSFPGHIQSSGLEERHIIGGTSMHASHISLPYDLSHSHTCQVVPFSTYPFDPDTLHVALTEHHHYTGLTGGNRHMPVEQREMGNHIFPTPRQDIHGVPGLSVLPGPSSTVIAEAQSTTTRKPTKKERDMNNKRAQRSKDREDFAEICELLEIPSTPRSDLVFRILGRVKVLVEKCSRLDSERERQCHLEEKEAGAAVLGEELTQLPAEENTSFPPIDVPSFLGDSDMMGATHLDGFGPTGRELDAWYT